MNAHMQGIVVIGGHWICSLSRHCGDINVMHGELYVYPGGVLLVPDGFGQPHRVSRHHYEDASYSSSAP